MISFRIDWFDLFAVQGTLKSFLPAVLVRFSHVRLCATPETAAHQAPPSLGFSRQNWSGLPFLIPGFNVCIYFAVVQSLCNVQLFATP